MDGQLSLSIRVDQVRATYDNRPHTLPLLYCIPATHESGTAAPLASLPDQSFPLLAHLSLTSAR